MCGFAGFTKYKNIEKNTIKEMIDQIAHRGPDESSIYISEKITVGHHRLSIIDLQGGKQPRVDDQACLVFNGEIYGYKEQAKLLKTKKINLKDNSDTEILFQLLKLYGIQKTLTLIDGMYSFAYYEFKNDTLWLVRDPMGEKPLYYSLQNNRIFFGSELSSLMPALKKIPSSINEHALLSYLSLDYIPNDQTILSNVKKVQPGQVIKYQNNVLNKYFYYYSNLNKKININKHDAISQLGQILSQSVKKRLVADVPVGVFLSGGIDSSLIAYYAKKHKTDIRSYTIKMNNSSYDESNYAELVANKLGIKNQIAEFDNNSILKSLETIEKKLDEPLGDPSILPTYLLSKFAKKDVKVALSGDGADELFCGYAPFKAINYLFLCSLFPKILGKTLSHFTELIPSKDTYMSLHFLIKHVSRGLGWPKHQQVFRWMSPLSDNNISTLLNKNFISCQNIEDNWNNLLQNDDYKNEEVTNILTKQFQKFYLANDILTKIDRASMYNGLEVRSPFLSKSIIDYSNALPNEFKLKNGQTKVILRKIASEILPTTISNRKKHGFAIPIAQMIRGPLKEKIQETLLSDNFPVSEYFNKTKLEKLLTNHFKGIDNRKPIWAIYMLYKNSERLLKLT